MKVSLGKPICDEEMRDAALDALQNERFVLVRAFSGLRRSSPVIVELSVLFLRVLGLVLCILRWML